MNLVIFDIDGTITDSVRVDDQCFIQSFKDLHNIDLANADWNNFKHVTDSGLTQEIFAARLNRSPSKNEIQELKNHFHSLLNMRSTEITEISGAKNTITSMIDNPNIAVAFATGGWRKTALLKLATIGFEIGPLPLFTADEHFDRSKITQLAIDEAGKAEKLHQFKNITYIGDGLWDYKTTQQLGITFIGVDHERNNKLIEAGATKVVNDLTNPYQLIEWIQKAQDNKHQK